MIKAKEVAIIRSLKIFRNTKIETIDRAADPSFLQIFPPGTVFLEEGSPADFLYIILDGLIEMSSRHNCTSIVVEILGPKDLFILAAVLNNDVCLQSARSLTPSRLLMIPASVVRSLMLEDAAFMKTIVFELACAYRRTVKELKCQKARTSAERLANWLLVESKKSNESRIVKLKVGKKILALRLGMSPENLSRSFAVLREHGVVTDNYEIHIKDASALEKFAMPSILMDGL